MITFYLIRHGDKVKDFGNVGITDKGSQQATITANYLINKNIDFIITSPLKRAIETTKIISTILGLSYMIDARLKERMSIGEIPNQSFEEYLSQIKLSVKDRNYLLPNGMTSNNAGKLFETVTHEFLDKPYQNIVIVPHGGIIGDYLRNIFSEEVLQNLSPAFMRYLQVSSCSITKIICDDNSFFLEELNSANHLPVNLWL